LSAPKINYPKITSYYLHVPKTRPFRPLLSVSMRTLPLLQSGSQLLRISLLSLVFSFLGFQNVAAQGNCECTNCPQFMPDFFTGNFFINVQNAANPTLGQNGQGVCGVNIHFEHEYVGDLQITLTSPAGQSITLIGPIGLFGPTDGTTWNIGFVPCADPAAPDPGFASTWNNNQPWGLGGNYTGDYYPRAGCLENFNTGPVNGTWTLTVTDAQAADVGTFFDYEIIFCDPTGIDCFSCAANAGQLLQPDVVACEGASSLDLNLPPTWTPASSQPPSSQYSYTYVIGGAGGVIQGFDPNADLSSYPPGVYTVCGMSYLTAQEGDIPTPNGVLTVAQLTTQLTSSTAPFCGRITTNCVGVTINAAPADIEQTVEICAPQCYVFNGIPRCASGTYIANLLQNGCPYTSTLYLTVNAPTTSTTTEYICEGECSANPNFPTACSPGSYTEMLTNAAGCDSLVTLVLIGNNVNAVAAPPAQIPCGGTGVSLSGAGSTTGIGVSYLWTASNGGNITGPTTTLNTFVNTAGDYQLRVCRTAGGHLCCDSVEVTVIAQTDPPNAPAQVNGISTVCSGQTFNYNVPAVSGATSYTWTVTGGTVNSGGTGLTANITWGTGTAGEICVTANNACGTSNPTCLTIAINQAPVVTAPSGPTTPCGNQNSTYSIPPVANALSYTWTVTAPAMIMSGQGTEEVEIDWNGATTANVCVRATNACGNSPQQCLPVTITNAPATPNLAGPASACWGANSTYTLSPVPGATSYTWTVTNGTITGGNGNTIAIVTWGANAPSGSICVTANNACGESIDACTNVTLTAPPASPIISGSATVCAGTTGSYSISSVPGASSYTWSVPAGATIVSGQNTNAIAVTWGASTVPGGNVCVAANSTCGASPQTCFPVQVSAVPNANAGLDQAVCATTATLSATPSVGTGQWTALSGPGVATFAAPTAANSQVSVTATGVYQFVWTENNATCTDNDQVQVAFNSLPSAGAIQPVCEPTNENYTISFAIAGGATPYTVAGGSVSNGVFTSNPIASGVAYSFLITDVNGCQSSTVNGSFNCNCATNAGTMNLAQLTACEGQSISAQHNNNATLDPNDVAAYVLHQGAGTVIINPISTNTTGVFSFQNGMTYGQVYHVSYVVGNNAAGVPNPSDPCLSVAQGQPVVFYQNPVSNAGANNAICGLSITLAGNANAGAGTWSVQTTPTGGTLNIADQTNPNSAATGDVHGVYNLTWTVNNNGCTDTDEVQITLNANPAAGQISTDCNNTNTAYVVTIPIVGGAAPYSINGTPVVGNSFISNTINSGTPYDFVITDDNGCVSANIAGTANCNCATDAGTMLLTPVTACEGDSVTATHNVGTETLDGDDVIAYVLHEGSGGAVVNPIATNASGTFGFQSGMTYGQTYFVSLVAGSNLNGLPNPADPCLSVAQGQPVVFYQNPTPDAGPSQEVCGQTLDLAAIGTGQWSVASGPAGGTLTFAEPTNPASSVTASDFGTYVLTWAVEVNGCSGNENTTATFNSNPALDNLVRDCDAANENFTVEITIVGGAAPYSVNGATIAGSTFISTPLPNGQAYSYAVEDANGCAMPTVTGAFSCNCATSAGTMSLTQLTACESATVTASANNDATLDGNDVTAFVLHDGQGPALGNVIAQNTTGTFPFNSNLMDYGVVYYISRVAGNPLGSQPNPADPCFSVAEGQPIIFLQNPLPDAGVDIEVCGTEATLAAVSGSFGGIWTVANGPVGGNLTFADPNDPESGATASLSGTYDLIWTENNVTCTGQDPTSVTFNQNPTVGTIDETCNNTNTAYLVTLSISGGAAPYVVSGLIGTVSGSAFTSNPVATSGVYTLTVTDANGCTAGPITGSKNCNCATDAGSMVTAPLVFCADQPAVAPWNNDATLDGDDIVQFILHTQAGSTTGQILATSSTPSFSLGVGLNVNTTYYISAIAGNGVAGSVDLTDDCLSVAPGTPVRWKPLPMANLSGDATLCAGGSAVLTFSGSGTYPLSLTYNDGSGTNASFVLTASAPTDSLVLTPNATTTFTLTNVTDGTLPACSMNLTDAVTIVVNQPVEAGTALLELDICANEGSLVQLADLLTNADPGGTWLEVSFNPALTGTFDPVAATFQTTGQQPGKYEFRYRIDAASPCTDDEVVVAINIRPQPTADAGLDQTIDCNTFVAQLGGSNTSVGSDLTYEWSLSGTPLPDQIQPTFETVESGVYNLLVTNDFGCSAQDQVLVSLNNEEPQIGAVSVRDVRCFGEFNGQIQVVEIIGGTPPYRVSLNGGPFLETTAFSPVGPGDYTLRVLDAIGCESGADTVTVAEPPQLVIDLGADVELKLGDSLRVEALVNAPDGALDTIIWQPLLDAAGAGSRFQHFFPERTNSIDVSVVDSSGCIATDRLFYYVDRRRNIFVPNIFQPEGSDNNVVAIYGGKDVEEVEFFRIYDRWGEMLHQEVGFEINDESKGWRGDFRGKPAQPAVYIWTAVVRFRDGERELFSGDVTVYR
jgi:large repetitive protein